MPHETSVCARGVGEIQEVYLSSPLLQCAVNRSSLLPPAGSCPRALHSLLLLEPCPRASTSLQGSEVSRSWDEELQAPRDHDGEMRYRSAVPCPDSCCGVPSLEVANSCLENPKVSRGVFLCILPILAIQGVSLMSSSSEARRAPAGDSGDLCGHGSLRQPQVRAGLARTCIWPDLWPDPSLPWMQARKQPSCWFCPMFLHCVISHVPVVSKWLNDGPASRLGKGLCAHPAHPVGWKHTHHVKGHMRCVQVQRRERWGIAV